MCDKDKISDECEEFETEVSLDTIFTFPRDLSEHYILGKHLIIAPEQANWLACDDDEYAAFCIFREGKSIREVENDFCEQGMDARQARAIISQIVAQIFGKGFEQKVEVREKEVFKIASLFITGGCNLRCSTCSQKATVAGLNECSYDDWKRFLEAFANVGEKIVTITGGEPMTNPDCLRIIQRAKSLGLQVVLLTNGTLITKESAYIIGNNCDEIQVSIDGPNAETHDSVRGKGTFEKAIAGLKELSVYPRCHLSIAMTPTPVTLPIFRVGLRKFIKWVWQNIRTDINLRVTQKLLEGRKFSCMSKEDEGTFREDVVALCDQQLEVGFIDKLDAVAIVPNHRIFGCGLAESFSVMPNGDVKVCEYSLRPFGNIKDIGGKRCLYSGYCEGS